MKLLVTRPEPDGSRLAERLRASGHEAVVEPLMTARHLDGAVDFSGVQAIAFTSANGVRALVEKHQERHVPVFAVGAATAAAARRAGFGRVYQAAGDVDHLAAHIGTMLEPEDGRILHVAGSVVAGDLQGSLAAFGFEIDRHVLYDTMPLKALSKDVITAVKDGSLEGVLVYSPRTGRILAALMEQDGIAELAENLVCYALSENVANAVAGLPFADCFIAETPDEDALMALLEED